MKYMFLTVRINHWNSLPSIKVTGITNVKLTIGQVLSEAQQPELCKGLSIDQCSEVSLSADQIFIAMFTFFFFLIKLLNLKELLNPREENTAG